MRVRCVLHHLFSDAAWQEWLQDLPGVAASVPPSQILQSGRNLVFWTEFGGQRVVVKRFSNRGAWKKMAYSFRPSKARRSYENSMRLIDSGLQTPQPIGWREDRSGRWLETSYYVCQHVDVAHEARALANGCATHSDAEPKAELVGREIARMHEARILHLDLTPGNLLFLQGSPGPDPWQLHIVDNNRMRFGRVSAAHGISSLLQVEFQGELLDSLLQSYAKTRGIDTSLCRKRYSERLRRYQLKWRIKNTTRPWRRRIGL